MDKNKTTKVMNVISEEIYTYYNSANLRHNLVSAIITSSEDKRRLLDWDYRSKIILRAKIEMIPGSKGDQKAYSPIFDMIAYQD
jgi:hypothetical protein